MTLIGQVGAAAALPSATPGAGSVVEGPRIVVDHTQVDLGEPLVVTLSHFRTSAVTVSVCGNSAARGSADCDMPGSHTERVTGGHDRPTQVTISAPPTTCPCVIRASSDTQNELAVAPIAIAGHPTGPVSDVDLGALVSVDLEVADRPHDLIATLRAALGGPTDYRVTTTVHNRTMVTIDAVTLAGSAGRRSRDDAASFDPSPSPRLAAGQSWRTTNVTRVAAPVFGRYTWEVLATGAGPTVRAHRAVSKWPVGLVLLLVVLVADLVVMALRLVRRPRRRPRRVGGHLPEPDPGAPNVSAAARATGSRLRAR